MEETKSKVYVYTDEKSCITRCEGGYTIGNIKNFEGWTLIDEGNGDRYNLCQSHYFEGGLYTEEDGIPRYKLADGKAQERTEDEIAADRSAISASPPTVQEQLRADVDFLAAMQGVTL